MRTSLLHPRLERPDAPPKRLAMTTTRRQPGTPPTLPNDRAIDALPTTGGTAGGTHTIGPFAVNDLLFGKAIETPEHEGGVLVQGGPQDISTLLPVVTQDGPSSVVQGFDLRVRRVGAPDTLEPIGLLAASWDVTEDASVYTSTCVKASAGRMANRSRLRTSSSPI